MSDCTVNQILNFIERRATTIPIAMPMRIQLVESINPSRISGGITQATWRHVVIRLLNNVSNGLSIFNCTKHSSLRIHS